MGSIIWNGHEYSTAQDREKGDNQHTSCEWLKIGGPTGILRRGLKIHMKSK